MEFTIANEDYVFNLVLDGSNHMTAFTATKDQDTYVCSIHLKNDTNAQDITCCYPPPRGCESGPC